MHYSGFVAARRSFGSQSTTGSAPCFRAHLQLAAVEQGIRRPAAAKRRQLVPDAPAVVFDASILPDVVRHNHVMEASNRLFHADQAQFFELIGLNPGLWQCRGEPKLLAQAIWEQFQASTKGHCEAQASPGQYRVAVSCSESYFIVRLYPIPVISNEEEYAKPETSTNKKAPIVPGRNG